MLEARHLCWANSKKAFLGRTRSPRAMSTWASRMQETETSKTPRQVQPIILTFNQAYLIVMLMLDRAKMIMRCSTRATKCMEQTRLADQMPELRKNSRWRSEQ